MILGRVGIIGLGLIGGSLGMALCRSKSIGEVIGYDLFPGVAEEAIERRAIHKKVDHLRDTAQADLVVLAVPVEKTEPVVKELLPFLKQGTILTDVASTKAGLYRTIPPMLPEGVYYVGGHPMAGTERSGIGAADPFLFENAVYLLTPGVGVPGQVIEVLSFFVRVVGGLPHLLDPEEHDVMVAAVSHLPHLAAAALVNTAASVEKRHTGTLSLAAGGFRDSTRIALGSPGLWREILLSNREPLLAVLDEFIEQLADFRQDLVSSAKGELEQRLNQAMLVREELPVKNKGFLTLLHELVVVIEDRPGAISGVVNLLAAQDLNIKDLELLHIREGEAGTLRLAFEEASTLAGAVTVLKDHGYQVQAREDGNK